jgi:ribokinase
MAICVFGSLNMDLAIRAPRLPQPGETLSGHGFLTLPGGKGANQAVAAARLGSSVNMVGRVGADDFGQQLLQSLQQQNVHTENIAIDASTHSGIAMITVAEGGENQIVLAAGANSQVDGRDVARLMPLLQDSSVLLLQLEIPIPAVIAAAQAAQEAGVLVILDPAPVPESFPDELYRTIDILTPNQTEAERLVGFSITSSTDAERAAIALHKRGVKHIIVTMGAKGAIALIDCKLIQIPAFAVNAIDTTAAGDAFNGAFAAALDQGKSWEEALQWGAGAGAIAATQLGAQPSLPNRESLLRFLQKPGSLS